MKIIDFALLLGKLKTTKRTGWLREKVPNPESVAEHSFRTAVLCMILAEKIGANTDKSVKMALIHDIGEAQIGDIVTSRNGQVQKNFQDKIDAERAAIQKNFSLVNKKEYIELFDEFEENKTREAQLVKQVDKLEMAIQALEYENNHAINLDEFFQDADSKILHKDLQEIMDCVYSLRK